ncbi:hypothetical protein SO802_016723, partial [Lithocarpus litseifolius]
LRTNAYTQKICEELLQVWLKDVHEDIELQVDAKSIVDLLNNSRNANNVISSLVDDCR